MSPTGQARNGKQYAKVCQEVGTVCRLCSKEELTSRRTTLAQELPRPRWLRAWPDDADIPHRSHAPAVG